jgi:hypothetical protein
MALNGFKIDHRRIGVNILGVVASLLWGSVDSCILGKSVNSYTEGFCDLFIEVCIEGILNRLPIAICLMIGRRLVEEIYSASRPTSYTS